MDSKPRRDREHENSYNDNSRNVNSVQARFAVVRSTSQLGKCDILDGRHWKDKSERVKIAMQGLDKGWLKNKVRNVVARLSQVIVVANGRVAAVVDVDEARNKA